MSKSYHRHYNYASGMNTEYYRNCARFIRNKHNQMMRNLVPVCKPEELDEVLFHIPKKAVYDYWGAPADYRCSVSKATFDAFTDLENETSTGSPERDIYWRRRDLIVRSRLKGYPRHNRNKYPYKELLTTA